MIVSQALCDALEGIHPTWHGCDWPTRFGPRRLDLKGVKSRSAEMMSRATRGQESQDWAEATVWLKRVEADAQVAFGLIANSIEYLRQGRFCEAKMALVEAADLETKHHGQSRYDVALALFGASIPTTCEREIS